MPHTFSYQWDTPAYKGSTSFSTGLFIGGEFVDGVKKTTIERSSGIQTAKGTLLTTISEATEGDVDRAVEAARKAFESTWGLNAGGAQRGELLYKLAQLMEQHADELAAIEALDNGKTFGWARTVDIAFAIDTIKHYAGWADKVFGSVMETDERKLAYTRHEPVGVVGQIIPWNFPLLMLSWKIGPALATGNAVILKPSEFTPLTALRMCGLINEAGFPPGSVNIVTGYGNTAGNAISTHMHIDKVAFTGSTLVGRKVMEAAAKSNLKNVTLELGGKSPTIVFDDANLEQAVNWAAHGLFWNHGQACCAGTRIFVQEGIHDAFLQKFTEKAKQMKLGDPFGQDIDQGPQVSQIQFDRIMSYIDSGKAEGATVHTGGDRFGNEGYFISPTIFTNTTPQMKIVQEEIFGPVGVVIKFKNADEVLKQANDTPYGLAASVFSQDINKALETAHKLQAGTAWVNCHNQLHANIPFGGFKQSGMGRELGEYALSNYTNVKAVHVNLGWKM
ncbi:Aldehyde dehydrogenase [Leucoagaricus sp. SymC.cos]|nr:Aldehyde dehydrogenase [Leucoagaricus sp. SymC.cos]KXN92885.1 Aldehyde dehydrogenase [Leucoagaricus sp. SymC.cos]